ncbi:RnaseH domain, transposon factor [Schizophyllum commune]
MAALMLAVQFATNYIKKHLQIHHIHSFADNTAAIGMVFALRPHAGQRYSCIFHERICKVLDDDEQLIVEIKWCPGHKDLAKSAAKMHSTETRLRMNTLRKVPEGTIIAWRRQWDRHPITRCFAIADCLLPSLKPLAHFLDLCVKSGEYYKDFAQSGSIHCPCEEPVQMRQHILQECPIYKQHQHILQEVFKDVALAELLGTPKGIDMLAHFLKKSGAFTKTGHPHVGPHTPQLEDKPNPVEDEGWEMGEEEDHEE